MPSYLSPRVCNACKSKYLLDDDPVKELYQSIRATPWLSNNLVVALVLKGNFELGAVCRYLAFVYYHVQFNNLGHAQIAQTLRSAFHRHRCGLFPGLRACAN